MSLRLLLIGLVVAAIAGVGIAASVRGRLTGTDVEPTALTYQAKRRDLLITITEDGSIESASNIDIKCEVAGGSTILSIIPDGTQVREGDELARLDSAVIEETINTQRIAFEKAQALQIQSSAEYNAAKIAVEEYLEGTFVQAVQTCEANIQIAMENLRSSQNTLAHTLRMARKGYVTGLQREAQAFAVERAKLDLKNAETAKTVLEKFTKPKMLVDLESKRDTAEAKMRSDQTSLELEEQKLKRLMTQLEKCLIKAPSDGMVIYANEYGWRGNQERQIEEGAAVRERQSLIKLPDLTNMQAKTLIHESKIETMQLGMRARVTVQDQEFQGEVTYIANQAEPPSPFSPSVKRYSTIVKIDGESSSLRPGMTAEVQILVANLTNVIAVPEQSVVEVGGEYFCFAPNGSSFDQRIVTLGMSDGIHIEIKSGLREGELVYQNPRRYVSGANSIGEAKQPVDVSKRFGNSTRQPGELVPGAGGAPGGPDGVGPDLGGPGSRRGGRGPGAEGTGPGGPDGGKGVRRRGSGGPEGGAGGPAGPEQGGPRAGRGEFGNPGDGVTGPNGGAGGAAPNAGATGAGGPGAGGVPSGTGSSSFGSPRGEGRGQRGGP